VTGTIESYLNVLIIFEHTLSTIRSFKHYSFVAFRRKIFRSLKKTRKFSSLEEPSYDFRLEATLSHEDCIAKYELAEEQSFKLQQAISALSARQREVIFLRFFDDFSNREIATIMSITIESVYKLISKAVSSIKKFMTELSLLSWLLLWLF
jgi:RNA polymerase sigma factor (sigma-70 family)